MSDCIVPFRSTAPATSLWVEQALLAIQKHGRSDRLCATAQVTDRVRSPGHCRAIDPRVFFPATSRERAEHAYQSALRFLEKLLEDRVFQ